MKLIKYKQICRDLEITQQMIGDYTGHFRETVNSWFNGKDLPSVSYWHIRQELDELIKDRKKFLRTHKKAI